MQKKSVSEYDEMASLIKSLKEKSVQVLFYTAFSPSLCIPFAAVIFRSVD